MTALTEFERLEAPGLWRETPEAQRRDVLLSIGDASLVISDPAGRALTHWSLPAIEKISLASERPALYRPAPDAEELLEIDDQTMIDALAKVHRAITRAQPKPGRLRNLLVGGFFAGVATLAVFWLPQALVRHAVQVVPPQTRAELGDALLNRIRRVAGPRCETPAGARALEKLSARLMPAGGRIVVLSGGVQTAAHLPGPVVLVNRALVEDHEDPSVLAGYVVAENARARQQDPLEALLQHTGLIATLRLLTTGVIPDDALDRYAERLLTAPPAPIPQDVLLAAFKDSRVLATPYAYALDATGEKTLGLIEADPMAASDERIVLSDGNWVALQGICRE